MTMPFAKVVPIQHFPHIIAPYHRELLGPFKSKGQALDFTEATKAIASYMPFGHYCLGALEMIQYKFIITSLGALYQEENALVPCRPGRSRPVLVNTLKLSFKTCYLFGLFALFVALYN